MQKTQKMAMQGLKQSRLHLKMSSFLPAHSENWRYDLKRTAKFAKKIWKEMPNSDSDWDYPITDEDLRTIDSVISSAPLPKRHHLSCRHDDASAHSPPRLRRRLPNSLFDFRQQQQRGINISTFPFSPGSSRSYYRRSSGSPVSPFQDVRFGGRIVYSRTAKEVEKAAQELLDFAEAKKRNEGQCILGLDIEWRPTFKKGKTQK